MNSREDRIYQKKPGFSFTELFLICGIGVVSYMVGDNMGYERGTLSGQYEARKNMKPLAVITHPVDYSETNREVKGKAALVISNLEKNSFNLAHDKTLSNPNLEVFVAPNLSEAERKSLLWYLGNLENHKEQ